MISKIKKALALSVCLAVLFGIKEVSAQDGANLFKTKCASCHTIGKGRTVGPDLQGITEKRSIEWLMKFIPSSKQMIDAGDPEAIASFQEFKTPMPDFPFSQAEIKSILEFIDGGEGIEVVADPVAEALQKKIDSILTANSPESILNGKELFNGYTQFTNKGASCAVCHNVTENNLGHGGLLAKDLTKAFTRLGGLAGIKGVIAMPPFPSMQETYANHPITEEEIAYIQLYLQEQDKLSINGPNVQYWVLSAAGGVGFIVLAIFIFLIWNKRKKRSVNYQIIKRQDKILK